MNIQPFKALYPNLDSIDAPDAFFGTVKYQFAEHFENGFFREAPANAMFLCEIHEKDIVRTGLVTAVDIEEYLNGNILEHEDTLSANEAHLTELLMQRKAMIKPVLLAYPPNKEIDALFDEVRKQPLLYSIEFPGEHQKHVYYKVSDQDLIRRIQDVWRKNVPHAYIADGHHRCSSNAHLYEALQDKPDEAAAYRYLLSIFFAFDQIVIHAYNRVVELPGDMSPTVFVSAISRVCNMKYMDGPFLPSDKHEMALYINREWYRLKWRKKLLAKYEGDAPVIDTDLLNEEILQGILGIDDIRSDNRITYVEGVSGFTKLVDKTEKGELKAAFYLFPITIEDFVAVAEAGLSLPPKSTWFEPRIKNGMISLPI